MMRAIGRFRVPDRPNAVSRFFLEELHSPRSARERLTAGLARRLPAAAGLGLLALVSRRSGEPGAVLLGPGLERHLGRAGGETPGGIAVVELRGHAGWRRSVAFLFPPGASRPTRVIKQAEGGPERRAVSREATLLRALGRSLSRRVATTIPEVLEVEESADRTSVVMTSLPGRPILVELARASLSNDRLRDRFRAAGEWLARFHGETAETRALPEDLRLPGGDRPARRMAIPVSRAHGDFWPRNVLCEPDAPRLSGVVDWEASEPGQLPHGDLFDFALTSVGCVPGPVSTPPPERVLGLALLADGPRKERVSTFLATYARAAGLDRSLLEPLLRLYLREIERQERELPWVPAERKREVIRTWCNELETASRPVFSG